MWKIYVHTLHCRIFSNDEKDQSTHQMFNLLMRKMQKAISSQDNMKKVLLGFLEFTAEEDKYFN